MRIAQLAPLMERVPPKKYGGTERVVYALAEELIKRGHEVTIFASGDSITSGTLRSVYPRALREAGFKDITNWTLLSAGMAYAAARDFDIIHDHLMPLSLPTANLSPIPVVGTMHGPFTREVYRLLQVLRKPHIVTISQSQRFGAADINHAGTVYNGLSMRDYPFGAEPDEYLLFVGRISIEKGVHLAIDVANELDLPLVIAAKLDAVDREYFTEYVEPRLSARVSWIGEVDEAERNRLMSKARCFLHPAQWREPFGLTLIESLACGCPAVGFHRGSIPEIIKNGETGYVVEDIAEMVAAVDTIDAIDRSYCRAYALEQFSAERMTDEYEAIYKKILEKHE